MALSASGAVFVSFPAEKFSDVDFREERGPKSRGDHLNRVAGQALALHLLFARLWFVGSLAVAKNL